MANNLTTEERSVSALVSDAIGKRFPMSLRVVLDKDIYNRVWMMAENMSKSPGLIGRHLLGNQHACFSIILVAMDFGLSPYMVAKNTFSAGAFKVGDEWVPGSIGFSSALVFAICEASGRLSRPPALEYFGDWDKVLGKFEIVPSQRTGERGEAKTYAKALYTSHDEDGLGVLVRLYIKGEDGPRDFSLSLRQAHPRNSTLWATDPKTQLGYAAVRRAVNVVAPQLLMGLPFDDDVEDTVPVVRSGAMRAIEPERDELLEMLDSGSNAVLLPPAADNANGGSAENDLGGEKTTTTPSLRDIDGEVYPGDIDGLTRWRDKWVSCLRDPSYDIDFVLEKLTPTLSDASILFDENKDMLGKIQEFGMWARKLADQHRGERQ